MAEPVNHGEPSEALAWAMELYAGQMYGDQLYRVHLLAVAEVLHRFGYGDRPELMAAVGQRDLSVTADTYTHAMIDETELDDAELLG